MMPDNHQSSDIVLGWKTSWKADSLLLPRYWATQPSCQGTQQLEDTFQVKASSIDQHTAIIAQSGAGKSFFLGRLIEEILLKTKSRCLVFDPNSDFRRVDGIVDESLWSPGPKIATGKRGEKFTNEAKRDDFAREWERLRIRVRTGFLLRPSDKMEQLRLWWPAIPSQILGQDLTRVQWGEFHYCHETLDMLSFLIRHRAIDFDDGLDLINEAHHLFQLARANPEDLPGHIAARYGPETISSPAVTSGHMIEFSRDSAYSVHQSVIESANRQLVERLKGLVDFVSNDVEMFYFGKAALYRFSDVLQTMARSYTRKPSTEFRLEVVDLPSLNENLRMETVGAILQSEWTNARMRWEHANRDTDDPDLRVPNFIVVDEAHNLMPAETNSRGLTAVRDEFRRIAAEGRKFGLFLIFVTQRPEKVDPLIFSECENKVIMRLNSGTVLKKAREVMGIEHIHDDITEKCLDFDTGRALILGKWTGNNPEIIYGAARRTVEGGRSLDSGYWAKPVQATEEVHQGVDEPSDAAAKT